MKRKVIQLAGKTLVVSLPCKWAKKYGVKKGDEMEAEEDEARITFKSLGKAKNDVKQIDVSELDFMLNRLVSALYKSGYDELEITYGSPKQYSVIMDVINRSSVGFEVIKQKQKTLYVKNLSELHSDEFENVLRRLFLTLLSSADDSLEYVKQGNLAGMEEIVLRDHLVNKYAELCRRILNVYGLDMIRKTTTYYFISEQLEKIGDGYKDFMKFMIKNKITKTDQKTQSILSDINKFLRQCYELFYEFNLPKLEEFGILGEKIKKDIFLLSETKSIRDVRISNYLYVLYSLTFDINGPLMTGKV